MKVASSNLAGVARLFRVLIPVALMLAVVPRAGEAADPVTLVWARAGDALTLDPHAMNEGPTLALLRQIYEPLIALNAEGRLEPALATEWAMTSDPKIWRLTLRKGIRFQDGRPLKAEDVVFSIKRAGVESSDMRSFVSSVTKVAKSGPDAVTVEMQAPDPLLPIRLSNILIMSQSWAREHRLLQPRRPAASDQNVEGVAIANGTGPYALAVREPGIRTDLVRNSDWWGWSETPTKGAIERIEYRPIPNAAERVAALKSGDVDFLQDVPVTAQRELEALPTLRVNVGADNRVIFLGLNISPEIVVEQGGSTGQAATVANPLVEKKVRRALDLAIDRQRIQRDVMGGQSLPSGVIAPPQINGYPRDLDELTQPDPAAAKALLGEAGFGDGFTMSLACPNDRYLNDAEICQDITAQLGEIGVKVNLKLASKTEHFPYLRSGNAQAYLLGWGVPTFDSAYVFANLFHSRSETIGTWNGTGFGDREVDKAIASLSTETDQAKRRQIVDFLWQRLKSEVIYLPIHIQTLSYAMKREYDIAIDATNKPRIAYARVIQRDGAGADVNAPLPTR